VLRTITSAEYKVLLICSYVCIYSPVIFTLVFTDCLIRYQVGTACDTTKSQTASQLQVLPPKSIPDHNCMCYPEIRYRIAIACGTPKSHTRSQLHVLPQNRIPDRNCMCYPKIAYQIAIACVTPPVHGWVAMGRCTVVCNLHSSHSLTLVEKDVQCVRS
jgi:hypothetical protein